MKEKRSDVVIIGGSYSGLAAAMGLGRALRNVVIIDSGLPANRFTPASHNFLTHDGRDPGQIVTIARQQVAQYISIKQISGRVVSAAKQDEEFSVRLADGSGYRAPRLVFATGIVDLMPDIPGFGNCWGKSVLHCPYCHGYEVRGVRTGILGNGEYAFQFSSLISNWTSELTLYTNGPSTLTSDQTARLLSHNIQVVQHRIHALQHNNGFLDTIVFADGSTADTKALYARPEFRQHSELPKVLGCELTDEGYIKVDAEQRTSVPGIYACGDNVTKLRTVANAVSMGTITAIAVNKDLVSASF